MRTRHGLAGLALLLAAAPVLAQERVAVGYAALSDGHCSAAQQAMMAEYTRTSDTLAVRGKVRSEPSGGDCRTDALSYGVRAARYFPTLGGWDAAVEFSASEQAAAAPYVLTDEAGRVLVRADGGALFGSDLPAGSAQTVVGAIGLSRSFGPWRVGGLWNLVPVDWARDADGRTLHLTSALDWRRLYLDVAIDVGADQFGELAAGYRHAVGGSRLDVGVGATYRWGIGAIDNGAPEAQRIAGAPFVRAGPPRDDALVIEISVGYQLGEG